MHMHSSGFTGMENFTKHQFLHLRHHLSHKSTHQQIAARPVSSASHRARHIALYIGR
ncbi:hypothetical protein C8Q76DRAFT_715486 [Earliella scabrosa]|nr:hypothetical protein C8Q76DRAFT_715486 [Earliella scabrosa]